MTLGLTGTKTCAFIQNLINMQKEQTSNVKSVSKLDTLDF